jgi:hypothetical protein
LWVKNHFFYCLSKLKPQNQNLRQNQNLQSQNHIKTKIQNQNFNTSFGFDPWLIDINDRIWKSKGKITETGSELKLTTSH